MFADLLLSLAVIFLATVSFQNERVNSTSPNQIVRQTQGSGGGMTGVKTPNGMALTYDVFDAQTIKADIENYLIKNFKSLNYSVIYYQAIGGYDGKTEYSDQGTLRATRFVIDIRKADIGYFERAGVDISTSDDLPTGSVQIRLAIAPN